MSHTTLYVDDVDDLYNKLRNANYSFVSRGLVILKTKTGKNLRAFIVRDPDGHAMLLEEQDKSDVAIRINEDEQIKIQKP